MEIRTLALVLGAAVTVVAGGVGVTACSSSSSSNNPVDSGGGGGNMDSSANNNGDSSSSMGDDTGTGTGDDGGTPTGDSGSGGGPDCGTIPGLHTSAAGSLFCGYDDAGAHITCTTGQECCLGGSNGTTSKSPFFPEECATYGSACPNQIDGGYDLAVPIACNQISDCIANGQTSATACCLQGATIAPVAGCGYNKAKGGSAIVCEGSGDGGAAAGDAGTPTATACGINELQVCTGDADCPSGMTCKAGKWKIYQLGFCQ
jgi:hypothetical protein